MTLYSVRNWNDIYENNRTRDLKHMAWLSLPNKHDGDGYTSLVGRRDGPAMFGCWIAILQIASKCDPRGKLIRDAGEPHTAQSLSRMSHMPAGLVARTLPILVEIGWMDAIPHEGAVPVLPFRSVPCSGEGGAGETKPPPPDKRRAQSQEEVRLVCAKAGIPQSDADWFWFKCEGNGWTNGGKPIKNWEMVLMSWKNAGYLPSQKKQKNTPERPPEDWRQSL